MNWCALLSEKHLLLNGVTSVICLQDFYVTPKLDQSLPIQTVTVTPIQSVNWYALLCEKHLLLDGVTSVIYLQDFRVMLNLTWRCLVRRGYDVFVCIRGILTQEASLLIALTAILYSL